MVGRQGEWEEEKKLSYLNRDHVHLPAKQYQGHISSPVKHLGRPLGGIIEAGAPQKHVELLPGFATGLLQVQIALNLWTAAGVQKVLRGDAKNSETSTAVDVQAALAFVQSDTEKCILCGFMNVQILFSSQG